MLRFRYLNIIAFSLIIAAIGLASCQGIPVTSDATPTTRSTETKSIIPTPSGTPSSHPEAIDLGIIGNGTAETVAWSPDSKLMAVAGSRGIYLYDTENWQPIEFIDLGRKTYNDGVKQVFFHSDGKSLFYTHTANSETGLYRYEIGSGKIERLHPDFSLTERGKLVLSPDGSVFASLGTVVPGVNEYDTVNYIELRRMSDGGLLHTLQPEMFWYWLLESNCRVVYSPDGKLLAGGGSDNLLRVWDTTSGALLYTREHDADIQALTFSPDGSLLISTGDDATLRFWEAATGEHLLTQRSFTQGIVYLTYVLDGSELLLGMADSSFQFWAVDERGLPVKRLESEISLDVYLYTGVPSWHSVQKYLSPDGQELAIINRGNLQIWNMTNKQLQTTLAEFSSYPRSIKFNLDGNILALVDQNVHLWQVDGLQVLGTLPINQYDVLDVAFHPNGNQIAVASQYIQIWDINSLQKVREFDEIIPRLVTYSPDGTLLAAAGWDSVWVGDAQNGQQLFKITTELRTHEALGFSPDGQQLILIAKNGWRVWALPSGEQLQAVDWGDEPIDNSSLYAPEKVVVEQFTECTRGGNLLFWNLVTEQVWNALTIPTCSQGYVSIHPGQRLLAFTQKVNDNAQLRLDDLASGHNLLALNLPYPIETLGFAPDGQLLAGVDTNRAVVHLWDISTIAHLANTHPVQTATPWPTITPTGTPTPASPDEIPPPLVTAPTPVPGAITAENAASLQAMLKIAPTYALPHTAAWAGDSEQFALGALGAVYVYQVGAEHPRYSFPAEGLVETLTFSPDQHFLAAQTGQRHLIVWDIEAGQELHNISDAACLDAELIFKEDGQTLTAHCWRKIYRLDLESGEFSAESAPYTAGELSLDGRFAISLGPDYVYLRNVEDRILLRVFENGQPWKAAFGPTEDTFFIWYGNVHTEKVVNGETTSSSGTVTEFWQMLPGQEPVLYQSISDGPSQTTAPPNGQSLQISADGKRLFTSVWDGFVRIWDIETGQLRHEIAGGSELYLAPNDELLLNFNAYSGDVQLLDVQPEREPALRLQLPGFETRAYGWPFAFSADGQSLVSGTGEYLLRWDLSDPQTAVFPETLALDTAVQTFAASPDGNYWATYDPAGSITIRNPQDSTVLQTLMAAPAASDGNILDDSVHQLLFSNKSDWLAAANYSHIWLWDLETGNLKGVITPDHYFVEFISSPDGRLLALSHSNNGPIEIWDTTTLQCLRRFDFMGGPIAFSPDGLTLAVVEERDQIVFFDIGSGVRQNQSQAQGEIKGLTFSPDGSLLAVSTLANLELWDVIHGVSALFNIRSDLPRTRFFHLMDACWLPVVRQLSVKAFGYGVSLENRACSQLYSSCCLHTTQKVLNDVIKNQT